MLEFKNITGKKDGKVYNDETVLVSSTKGDFKITPLAAKKLEVKDGDFALLVVHPDDNKRLFITKGLDGVITRDENNVIQKDGRGRVLYEEGTGVGAVVRQASEGSPLLKVSATAAWNAAGGNADKVRTFRLGEGVEGTVPTGGTTETGDPETITGIFYELEFISERDKSARTVKTAKAEGEDTDVATAEEAVEEGEYEEEEI